MTIEDLKIKLRNEFDRYQSYDMLDVSKCPFSWWTERLPGHAAHVAPVAPASLDPRVRGHAVHVALAAPASLDPRLRGHAALSLHHTIFETLMHSIVSARGR